MNIIGTWAKKWFECSSKEVASAALVLATGAAPYEPVVEGKEVVVPAGQHHIDAVIDFSGGGRFATVLGSEKGVITTLPSANGIDVQGPIRLNVSSQDKEGGTWGQWTPIAQGEGKFRFTIAADKDGKFAVGYAEIRVH